MGRRGTETERWLLALALAGGFVDVASYLGLGHVFTANMTGNTVLLGVALARGSGSDAIHSAAALGGFCLGAAAGMALIRAEGAWPGRSAPGLLLEAGALLPLLVIWALVGSK